MKSRDRDPQTAEAAECLRRTIALRRDRLVAKQRRRYSAGRARLIEQLGSDYDAALRTALRAGAED